jgi:hypothetical protein
MVEIEEGVFMRAVFILKSKVIKEADLTKYPNLFSFHFAI